MLQTSLKSHAEGEVGDPRVLALAAVGVYGEVEPRRTHGQHVLQAGTDGGPEVAEVVLQGNVESFRGVLERRQAELGPREVRRDVAGARLPG